MITHGSTFSGIGAPEIAAEMLGWENKFHCEINPFGRHILDYYFPNAESYEDITKTDFSKWRGKITVLTGGFPCQPFSYAGKRRGSEDDRYLWPGMLKCIKEIRPTWFIGENVAGIKTMVLPSDPVKVASGGTLFDTQDYMERNERYVIEEICEQLENIGYSVQPMLIPACAVGAPHRRDRIFFIAHDDAPNTNCGQSESRDSRINGKSEKNKGYKNGTKYSNLESQLMYDPRCHELLPTPLASEVEHRSIVEELKATGTTKFHSRANGETRPNGIMDYLRFKDMLPTPTAMEGEKFTNTYNPNSQMGQSLSAMAGSQMLPTPAARDWKGKTNPGVIKDGSGCKYGETLPDTVDRIVKENLLPTPCAHDAVGKTNPGQVKQTGHVWGETIPDTIDRIYKECCPKADGVTFRLSPLFTEEMMGFPLMWTALPFLSDNGKKNH